MNFGSMRIFCCGCQTIVKPRITTGEEIYPHRPDLYKLPFWICDACKNYVGCHHKSSNPTKPLGNIPTAELRNARKHIHAILDPLWKSGKMKRGRVYRAISDELGYQYHTAEIKTIDEARRVWMIVDRLRKEIEACSGS